MCEVSRTVLVVWEALYKLYKLVVSDVAFLSWGVWRWSWNLLEVKGSVGSLGS